MLDGTRVIAAEAHVQDSVSAVGSALAREVRRRAAGDSVLIKRLREELKKLTDRQIALTVPMEFPKVYDEYTFLWNAGNASAACCGTTIGKLHRTLGPLGAQQWLDTFAG